MMKSLSNKLNWMLPLLAGSALLILPGCTTGLFRPVQPWYTVDSYQQPTPQSNNAVSDSQPVWQQQTALPQNNGETPGENESVLRLLGNQQDRARVEQGSANKTENWLEQPIQPATVSPAAERQDSTAQPLTNTNWVNDVKQHGGTSSRGTGAPAMPQFEDEIQGSGSNSIVPPIQRGQPFPPTPHQRATPAVDKQPATSPLYYGDTSANSPSDSTTTFYRAQSPEPQIQIPNGGIGDPQFNPLFQSNQQTLPDQFPQNYADLDIFLSETSTGRINFGGAYNSDSGLVGQFVIDERNFDIFRLPRNFREIVDGTAFRGGGQNFRLELVPGSDVERYLVSFSEPFLAGTRVSFSSSLYYFQRQFFDYDSERLGGRFALGYRLTPDISVSTSIRLENVEISDPRNASSPELNAVVGDTDLYVGNVGIVRDTRDHPFLPTEGTFTSVTFSQAFGEFDYSRGDIDFRTYRLIYQRPDFSGRHTLSYSTRLGFTGSQTPVFENYFAGGFSTLRGFDFRGASPIEGDIRVGGEFQWLNSLEYTFPITADDMVKGVLFTDFGTVEQNIELQRENFRVAPGFGFRVHLPAAGIGAPLAFDFAFPISDAAGDEQQTFSFYLGVNR